MTTISLEEAKAIAEDLEVRMELGRLFEGAEDVPSADLVDLVRVIVRRHLLTKRVMPQAREVGRMGDMAPPGRSHMRVLFDCDNDVCVEIWDQEHGQHGARAGIEFCTTFGGGKSPRTRDALVAVMAAMEADNAESPRGQWPPVTPIDQAQEKIS